MLYHQLSLPFTPAIERDNAMKVRIGERFERSWFEHRGDGIYMAKNAPMSAGDYRLQKALLWRKPERSKLVLVKRFFLTPPWKKNRATR